MLPRHQGITHARHYRCVKACESAWLISHRHLEDPISVFVPATLILGGGGGVMDKDLVVSITTTIRYRARV